MRLNVLLADDGLPVFKETDVFVFNKALPFHICVGADFSSLHQESRNQCSNKVCYLFLSSHKIEVSLEE